MPEVQTPSRPKATYTRIENVLRFAKTPLAVHEFANVCDPVINENGRAYIGVTESTLGRRLRELRELGRVRARRRSASSLVEYYLPEHEQEQETEA